MQQEMVDRHKGIATESSFSLAMYRWVNKIIEFISVVQQMEMIGIVEIEAKINKLKQFKDRMAQMLAARVDNADNGGDAAATSFIMFRELRRQKAVTK